MMTFQEWWEEDGRELVWWWEDHKLQLSRLEDQIRDLATKVANLEEVLENCADDAKLIVLEDKVSSIGGSFATAEELYELQDQLEVLTDRLNELEG